MANPSTLSIAVLLPDLLGTYGDGGNAVVLAYRLRARGYRCEILPIHVDQPVPTGCDIYLLGGAEDTAGPPAARILANSGFPKAVHRGATVLAVCAGLQLLGITQTASPGSMMPPTYGLELLDVTTFPAPQRAIGEAIAQPAYGIQPGDHDSDRLLTGFENHRGRTVLGPDVQPLARTLVGVGNGDGHEGVARGNLIATYLHGPVLARNPGLADHILALATGAALSPLPLEPVNRLRHERLRHARHARRIGAARRHARTPAGWRQPGIVPASRRGSADDGIDRHDS